MTTNDETFEVYALRYASRPGRASKEYYGFELYGEPDAPAGLDYFFWVARNEHRTVLLDCGYNKAQAAAEGRYLKNEPNRDPLEVLALLGIEPEDVDHVLITHMHHDHVGNLRRFPRATFSISRQEYDFCTGPLVRRELFGKLFDLDAIDAVVALQAEGRLQVIEADGSLFPGMRVSWVGGHSPGQVITEVSTTSGNVVLASDAIHFYDELELDRPFWVFTDLEESYRAYERLRALAATPRTTVVAGHDPAVMRRFAAVHADAVVDLAVPVAEVVA
jgi:glyoxylase-like metal-dependent hydrolase (beta-lactamase superfamily II)